MSRPDRNTGIADMYRFSTSKLAKYRAMRYRFKRNRPLLLVGDRHSPMSSRSTSRCDLEAWYAKDAKAE